MRERRASRRPGETYRGSNRASRGFGRRRRARRGSRGRRTAEWLASGAPCQLEVEDIISCCGWKRRANSLARREIEPDCSAETRDTQLEGQRQKRPSHVCGTGTTLRSLRAESQDETSRPCEGNSQIQK